MFVAPAPPAGAQPSTPEQLLASADFALEVGRSDEAAERYLDILTTSPPDYREAAWSGLVRARASGGRPLDAAIHASLLLRHAPQDAERVQYLRGRASFDGGNFETAALAFRTVEAAGGPLAPAAHLRTAQALAARRAADDSTATIRRDVEAVAAFRAITTVPSSSAPSLLRVVARSELVDALFRLDRNDQAHEAVAALASDPAAGGGEIASARWAAAQSRLEDDDPRWTVDAAAVVVASPSAAVATLALDTLEDAGVPVSPLQAGYVRYRARDNEQARGRYLAALETPLTADEQAVAHFFLAAIAERIDNLQLAIYHYGRSIELAPGAGTLFPGGLADDSLWWRGLLLQDLGRFEEASEHFRRIVTDFPSSSFAGRAALRDPLALARAGDIDAAVARLRALTTFSSSRTAARAALWLGELTADESAPAPATFNVRSIATILDLAGEAATAPLTSELLEEWGGAATAGGFDDGLDANAARLWLRTTTGGAAGSNGPPVSVATDPRLVAAPALAAAGEPDLARSAFFELRRSFQGDRLSLLEIAIVAREAGLHDIAAFAASDVLFVLSATQRLVTPLAIERLAYPLPYGELVRDVARDEGIPPLLLLALVRQESRYNPLAVSHADAVGLTQVIPPTGRLIAQSLGIPWDPSDLTRPASSLRFGASYLAGQIERFDGNIFAALAAYNGGPHNAERWLQQQWHPGGAGYIDAIDFSETEGYIEDVIEQYAWYRYLYAGAARPSIR
ncbi:MAG: transglycosylase SLT domain-containing protein [Dehalococcoidia bacterium]|nr:transglycosylase SLT domain-containing protein [Dehalococcoidia bacterium]